MPDHDSPVSESVDDQRAVVWDDFVLGALFTGIGGFRVVLGIVENERFGAEATLAVIVSLLGLLVLLSAIARRWTVS